MLFVYSYQFNQTNYSHSKYKTYVIFSNILRSTRYGIFNMLVSNHILYREVSYTVHFAHSNTKLWIIKYLSLFFINEPMCMKLGILIFLHLTSTNTFYNLFFIKMGHYLLSLVLCFVLQQLSSWLLMILVNRNFSCYRLVFL